ncbi:MAG: CHAT domain-containing protein [bacterium]|nr:CHAT domain-containing protein [bacterium]
MVVPVDVRLAEAREFVAGLAQASGFEQRLQGMRAAPTGLDDALGRALLDRGHEMMRHDPTDAGVWARLARMVARDEDHAVQLEATRVRGESLMLLGRFEEALAEARGGSSAADEVDALEERSKLDHIQVQALTHLDRYEDAMTLGSAALSRCNLANDPRGAVLLGMSLANLAFRMDLPKEALRYYREVEGFVPGKISDRLAAMIAANRANALERCNRFRAAERQFDIALALFRETGHEHTLAAVKYNAAYANSLRGRYQLALARYQEVIPVFESLGDAHHLAQVGLDSAEIYLHLHLFRDAREQARVSEQSFADLGISKERAQASFFMGRAEESLGNAAEAAEAYARAEEVFEGLGLQERRVGCMLQRARVALEQGCLGDARRICVEADELLTIRMNPLSRVALELLEARIDLAEGEPPFALKRIRQVRALHSRLPVSWARLESAWIEASAHQAQGDIPACIAAYCAAIEELERCRLGVPPDEFMTAFLAGHSRLYEEIVTVLVDAGEVERAFEYSERARSRALIDLLAREAHPAASGDADPTAKRVRYLRERLTAIYRRLAHGDGSNSQRSLRSVRQARHSAVRLEEELGRISRDRQLRNTREASLITVQPPDLTAIRADLGSDATIVEYFLTSEHLFIFVVTSDDVRVTKTTARSEELRFLLQRFHFHLSKFEREDVRGEDLVMRATNANLQRLAAAVLTPVAQQLRTKRLVVVPHGVLHHMPLHALPWGNRSVMDRFDVVYVPSAAVYGHCRREAPCAQGPAAVFGLPDERAPEIADEVKDVAARLDTDRVYVGDEATYEQLKVEAREARILHLATHGMFRPEQPMLSSIRLADRWVNLYDLYDLQIGGELVVLSTCESGIADVSDGNEILGLTRGFLSAGSPALITGQWRVNDAATRVFMRALYDSLAGGQDLASAHRAAMSQVRAENPHPYYWAPFFLTGRPSPQFGRDASTTASSKQTGAADGQPSESTAAEAAPTDTKDDGRTQQ